MNVLKESGIPINFYIWLCFFNLGKEFPASEPLGSVRKYHPAVDSYFARVKAGNYIFSSIYSGYCSLIVSTSVKFDGLPILFGYEVSVLIRKTSMCGSF